MTTETTATSTPSTSGDPDDALTIFMLVKATRAWLDLSLADRAAFLADQIRPILARRPEVELRFYDTEFYSAEVSDVLVWRTTARPAYEAVIEDLRDTRFWDHYFSVISILPGVENAYVARLPKAA